MRRLALGTLLLVVLLVVLAVTTAATVALYAATDTGGRKPLLERFRWRVAFELVRALGVSARPAHARALLAIFEGETGGRAAPQIGDVDLAPGPSVGPGQVTRALAKELGLWTRPPDVTTDADERDVYASVAWDEDHGVKMAAQGFAAKLRAAGGDVADAVRRYNGGVRADRNGNGIPDAFEYRDARLAFARATWGEEALS